MTKKILSVGSIGLLAALLWASPAPAEHRHAFEGGFKDELGRISAHAAVNLGAAVLGGVLNGSGLAQGAGYPYGGRGWGHGGRGGSYDRHRGYYDRSSVEHHHHHHYRDRVIKKKVYIYNEYYPRGYNHRYGDRSYYEGEHCD